MKQISAVFCILFRIQSSFAYNADALDYIVRAIEFLESVHVGVFSCVFWDISARHTYDNIQQAVLESSRLTDVVRYVVKGSHRKALEIVPWSSSVLFIWPGYDAEYLNSKETRKNIYSSTELIDPSTKVVIFADLYDLKVAQTIGRQINNVRFRYFVIFDGHSMRTVQCNGAHDWMHFKPPHSMWFFYWWNRWMTGLNIVYAKNGDEYPFDWNYIWVHETARYMQTEAVEYRHSCRGSGKAFYKCLDEQRGSQPPCDIIFTLSIVTGSSDRHTESLFTTIPLFVEIVVPRDRPLNVAELLLMPFRWQVWMLLVTILVMSEVVKHRFPDLFRNNPTLLAICGFERYNLHRAGSLEKVLFLSLIVLMFFMSNAFETKIVSLMVRKPSIQRINTLDDVANSDLKFHFDLDSNPHFANHSVIGKMVAHGSDPWMYDTKPGIAMIWYSDFVELRKELAYDYERMQPFYVLLGYRYFHSMELYWTTERFIYLKPLQLIHIRLVEAGLIDLWKRAWRARMRYEYIGGRRPRMGIDTKMDLTFEDIQLAWISLAAGLAASGVVFAVEVVTGCLKLKFNKE